METVHVQFAKSRSAAPGGYYVQDGCWSCDRALRLDGHIYCLSDGTPPPSVSQSSEEDARLLWEIAHGVQWGGMCPQHQSADM